MRRVLVLLAAMALPLSALALPFDFTAVGSNNTNVGLSVTNGGVTADGFDLTAGTTAPLWLRNETNDHGLGVCSEGDTACKSGGGDVNELTNAADQEAIRLTRPVNTIWTSLWVSSLDNGGSNNAERGILLWSNSSSSFSFGNSFAFGFGDFPASAVEGDLLTLAAAARVRSHRPLRAVHQRPRERCTRRRRQQRLPGLEGRHRAAAIAGSGAGFDGLAGRSTRRTHVRPPQARLTGRHLPTKSARPVRALLFGQTFLHRGLSACGASGVRQLRGCPCTPRDAFGRRRGTPIRAARRGGRHAIFCPSATRR